MKVFENTIKFLKIFTVAALAVWFFVFVSCFSNASGEVLERGGYKLTKLSEQKDFSLGEDPSLNFEFKRKQNAFGIFKEFLVGLFVDQYRGMKVDAEFKDDMDVEKLGLKPKVEYKGEGSFAVSIDKQMNRIRPGKYKILLNIEDPNITNGESISFEQDFYWGVLAMNANKAQYYTGEEAYLQMGVLDDKGHTLCDAKVYLEISAPDGGIAYLNTDNGLITPNPLCGPDNVIDTPDYFAHYGLGGVGEYRIKLRAETKNGSYEIADKIEVASAMPFEIERMGPTRINPKAAYDVSIKVKANQNYNGDIIEFTPSNFEIKNYELTINNESGHWKSEILDIDNKKLLKSKGVQLKQGDEFIITYSFDAPDISPEFYLLGGLEIGGFIEKRNWQIAADAALTYLANAGTSVGWTTATNAWNNVNNNYASRAIPRRSADDSANYLEGNANTTPSNNFVITNVEIGIEGYVQTTEVTPYVMPRFNGATNGSSYPISGFTTTDTNTINWASVFGDSNAPVTWTWADIQNMDIRVYGLNSNTSQTRNLYIDQMYIRVTYDTNVAPTISFVSIGQKNDGSGAVDISMSVNDADADDQLRVLARYEAGTTCTSPVKATIDEIDVNTTSTRSVDPKVLNSNEYQIGNSSGWIITSEGANTVNFDWLSDTDVPNASGTYCVNLIAYDGVDQSTPVSNTVVLDNYPPQISNVTFSPSSGVLKIGDTVTATIVSDGTGYTAGAMTINGVNVASTLIDNNNNTYTVTYTVADGNTDILDANDLPISLVLKDNKNNSSSAYTTANAAGRPGVDAHKPIVSSVTITNNTYKIGDTVTLVITVSSDTDAYAMGASTINNVNAQNLVKVNNTTYNIDYVVAEGNTDRSAGTIPISIVLRDTAGNQNDAYTVLAANTASIDAHRPVITALAIPNLIYKVGDTIKATATVNADAATYALGVTTINNVNASNLQKINDSTYTFDYLVAEGNADRTAGTIPISAIFRDPAGNQNTAFTTVNANTATLDAHTPTIYSVVFNPLSGIVNIGSKATATISVGSAETGLLAGTTMTINGVNVIPTFSDIGGGSYLVVYTVQSGNTDRSDSDDLPVNLTIRDSSGNQSSAFITPNPGGRPGIDAHEPIISNVTFAPTLGVLKVGDKATATIQADNTGFSADTILINNVNVGASLIDKGDNTYTVVYTVGEGNNDILDANDLPISIRLKDVNNNVSVAYTTANAGNRPGVDAHTPTITNVTFAPTSGVLKVGDRATATIAVSNSETGLSVGSVLTINGINVSGSFADLGGGNYRVSYTVSEGHTDILDTNDLPINFTIKDAAGNQSPAYTTANAGNRPGIDAHTPTITNVTFSPTSGVLKVGDTATATIAVSNSETGILAGSTLTINGTNVSGSFTELGGGNYRVTYTVSEGHSDILGANDLPINFTVKDTAGNISPAYTTANAANRPGVDAHTPTITNVTFSPASGVLKVGDTATATISVSNSETGILAGSTLTINGTNVSGSFTEIGGGNYRVTYTVSEGNSDILDANDLPINFTVKDPAGNQSPAYTTADSSNRPGVDAHTPTITNVTFSPASGVLKVGDTATATISVSNSEIGILAGSTLTINGTNVSGSFTEIGGGNYRVTYTVSEGNTDILDTNDLPINFTVKDSAGNQSPAYTTADAGNRPGVDGNRPTLPGDLSFSGHTANSITIAFGAPSSDTSFKEYKIFYKIGLAGVNENDTEFNSINDPDLSSVNFNNTSTTTISGLQIGTNYVFNIYAYDFAGNISKAATELITFTNRAPNDPDELKQLKNDQITPISNQGWTNEDTIKLTASSSDPEEDPILIYFQLIPSASSTITATTVPSNACAAIESYGNCASKVWSTAGEVVSVTSIPDSASGYKWQAMACDDEGTCSNWAIFNAALPNIKVDHTLPSSPGDLSVFSKDSTSVVLTFGNETLESNFVEYKVFYAVGTENVSESDFEHSSATDPNLGYQNYNTATSTLIDSLSAGTDYVINIWAYDAAGNKASATRITFSTNSASNPPVSEFNSAAQKTDGSGKIDISVEVDDVDNDDTVSLRLDYEEGTACVFASPLDPTLDPDTEHITADYGDPAIDNSEPYQIGTGSGYILTSPGSNTVNFDWLSATDLPNANGVYCLRMTAFDGEFTQAIAATTTVYIDNLEPSKSGNLSLYAKNTYDLILDYSSSQSVDDNFLAYKIFYKQGTSGVSETDLMHLDANLSSQNFNGNSTTTVSGLQAGTSYVFNIYAYDDYGNKSSADEQSFSTNYIPSDPVSLSQKKNDNTTAVSNNAWTDENGIRLNANIIDADQSETLRVYFELRPIGESFLTAASAPANPCAQNEAYGSCSSKVWSVSSNEGNFSVSPFAAQVQPSSIPDSATGYKWQVMACDDHDVCSNWADAGNDPNFKVDTIDPGAPGNLSLSSKNYNSLTLNFGTATNEANFREYVIYYKVGNSGVTEADSKHSSSSDMNLFAKNYNGIGSTTITGLLENTEYVINIWAYDEAGHKTSATELLATTNNRPSGNILSSAQKTDGSGAVDVSIQVSDSDNDNSKARLEYAAGAGCDFSSSLDPSLDETDNNATSTYGDARIENDNVYQIGNLSGWILTSSGQNTVNFDWSSLSDIPDADDTYCLRLTANDSNDDQATPDTSILTIDNKVPTVPGNLILDSSNGNSITLRFGSNSADTHFAYYKIFYKQGVAIVNENDTEHNDPDLNSITFNDTATTTVSGLNFNTQYSFNIYAYDAFGNKSNSEQVTYTTNAPPTGIFNSVAQKTDGSGTVDISIEVYDMNLNDCTAKLEYVAGAACDFSSPLDPTLDQIQASINADYGTPTILNSSAYQIGSDTKIITNQGSNTINLDWQAASDIGGLEGDYCLRLTVNDGLNDQAVSATSSFFYDDIDPTLPDNLNIGTVKGLSVELNFGTPSSDSSFKEYKIFYKQGTSGVSQSDMEFNSLDDPNLDEADFNSATYTTIRQLLQSTDYVFNIWAYDDYGNFSQAPAEVSTTTVAVGSATWREPEDTPDPTTGNYLARQENIRLRVDIANTGDYDATQKYDLEYGIKAADCYSIENWITVPAVSTTEHFSFVSSDFLENLSPTTPKLSNADGYAPTAGYVVESPSSITGDQNLAGGSHAEMEFVIEPTGNATAGTTYCFRSTNDGDPLDFYRTYPVFSIAPLPTSSFVSAAQKSDGSESVHISFDAFDVNGEISRAKLEYVLGGTCDFSSPLDPTIDETDEKIVATYGDPAVDNGLNYQIGTGNGWILTNYGTNTVEVDWDTILDLNDADDTYCLRLTFNDGYDDQAVPATTTVVVDHISPTQPGYLTKEDVSSNSVTFGIGTTSADTNFKEYKIFYKEGSSGVTESDTLWGSSSDPNLGFADLNGATTTTVTGLEVNKQYVFQVWTYDDFGHKSVASQEVSVIIRYVSRSENWRWYADQDNETPTSSLAMEGVTPIDVSLGSDLKLRLGIREIEGITGQNIKMRLEYSTFSDFSSDVNFVGEQGSSTAIWNYGDGIDQDNDMVTRALLSGLVSGATHNESGTTTTTYDHSGGTAVEWEFTIRNNGALPGNTYYFRAYDNTNQTPIMTNTGFSFPSVVVASSNLSYSVSGQGENASVEGVNTTVGSTHNVVDFGHLIPGGEEIAAQRFIVDTNAGGGYQLFVYQRQNLIAGNGADIDPVPYPNATPNAWPVNPDSSAFGYHAGDDTLSGASPSRFSADNTYAGFSNDFEEISYSSVPVENEAVDLVIRLSAGETQEAGEYETELVYILLPTFYE